jgi:hypothetical protein
LLRCVVLKIKQYVRPKRRQHGLLQRSASTQKQDRNFLVSSFTKYRLSQYTGLFRCVVLKIKQYVRPKRRQHGLLQRSASTQKQDRNFVVSSFTKYRLSQYTGLLRCVVLKTKQYVRPKRR